MFVVVVSDEYERLSDETYTDYAEAHTAFVEAAKDAMEQLPGVTVELQTVREDGRPRPLYRMAYTFE